MRLYALTLAASLLAGCCGWCGNAADPATPVWVKGCATEMNAMFGFRGDFTAKAGDRVVLKLTGSSVYRIYVNGRHAGYGPARGPVGFFRLDEWDVSRFVKDGRNVVAVEVSAYNVNNYYIPDQPGFLQAEVTVGGRRAISTPDGFKALRLPRVRKCSRFSFQRGFGEAYELVPSAYDWRTDGGAWTALPLEPRPAVKLIDRRAPYPKFEVTPMKRTATTVVKYDPNAKFRPQDYVESAGVPGKKIKGYLKSELAIDIWAENQRLATESVAPAADAAAYAVKAGQGVILDAGINRAGFFGATVTVRKPGRLGVVFDELLVNGKVSTARFSPACGFYYDFKEPGVYAIENFEPNVLRWAHLFTFDGDFALASPYFRNYRTPAADGAKFDSNDPELRRIFEAARETFAQNAVDVFTDCPSRERAGWLCDSYFTSKSSRFLTGSNALEDLFLENYLLPEKFDIDDGMLPMCYPSDHPNGNFIPNWAMWLVIELDEYVRERGGDRELVAKFKPRLVKLVEYLRRFRNSDGLLERLPRWVFVEWSQANRLVQDVNYPSNMTWAEVLDCMDRLYGMPELAAEAKRVRETVRRQSWTGEWFCDNAQRQPDGTLKLSGECTETCQYYAFFFKTATPELYPELWRRITTDFGPQRQRTKAWPKIWPANAFIGNYLRLEMLSRAGLGDQVVKEIRGYFLKMADTTGTLWENDTPTASCDHGFASYVAVLLDRHARAKADNGVARWDPRMANENAVVDKGVKWIDGRHLPIEGRAFADVEHYFDRLPANVTSNVNGGVRAMKHHTSGMMFRFSTDSSRLHLRWKPYNHSVFCGDNLNGIATSGFDVYGRRPGEGKWRYRGTFRISNPEGSTQSRDWTPGDECLINLPLYNGVREVALGIDPKASVKELPPHASGVNKPVVFYGTSITHGGCATRPGLGFVNVIGRELDVPVVNLGFSGSGVMEFEMSEHIARIDASCYVLDCLWNMSKGNKGGNRNVDVNYEPFIRNLRAKRPGVPIVMAEQCDVFCGAPNDKDVFIRKLYERLIAEGWKELYYLPKTHMYSGDGEGTVDGCHPNDLGMMTMAKAFGTAVREALKLK